MKAKTVKERIEHFTIIHKGFYDYSLLTDPVKWDSKIPVVCPVHGVFETIVNNHARGAGCPSCAGVKLITREERINQAKEIHGGKYDYSLWSEDVTVHSMVESICPEHGLWRHSVANHIQKKSGCPACARNKPRTFETFVKAANKVHDYKYRYVLADDVRSASPVTIECPVHGLFTQLVSNHLSGKGCSACASYGFDPKKPAWFYMLQAENMFKVGITNKFEQRMKQLKQSTPFRFTQIQKIHFANGADAQKVERFYLMFYESAGQSGFDGATEWLKGEPDVKVFKGA